MLVKDIPIKDIVLAKNSRLGLKDSDVSGLMSSIKSSGLLQPIGVSKTKNKKYSICYGNRRFLACKKLGIKTIPAVIQTHKNMAEEDLKNLTENIQRRPISLVEGGRYVHMLNGEGLSNKEISVRLGVTVTYVKDMLQAFKRIPTKFHSDIEINVNSKKKRNIGKASGKISLAVAKKILSARGSLGLKQKDVNYLLESAKNNNKFAPEQISTYAIALVDGKKDPVNTQASVKRVHVNIIITEREYKRLVKSYVANGKFSGMSTLFQAILKGKVKEKVSTRGTY